MKNLEFISEWKKQGKINLLMLNFVVHLMNYKEMPDFVKLAQRLDAIAFFPHMYRGILPNMINRQGCCI